MSVLITTLFEVPSSNAMMAPTLENFVGKRVGISPRSTAVRKTDDKNRQIFIGHKNIMLIRKETKYIARACKKIKNTKIRNKHISRVV